MKSKAEQLSWNLLSEYRTEIMGVACLSVMLGHFADVNVAQSVYKTSLVFRLFSVGNVGVDIFLLISGIGLYYSYSRSKEGFYKRRLIRILLPYLIICIPYYFWKDIILGVGKRAFVKDCLQISFFTEGMQTTWYIPAILIFYFIFPVLYKFLYCKNANTAISESFKAIALCLLLCCICLLLNEHLPDFYSRIEIMLTRSIVFCFGCYLGGIVKNGKIITYTQILGAAGFFLIYIFVFRDQVSLPAFWTRMCFIGLAVSFVLICCFLFSSIGHSRFLIFFGERSLEFYLLHVLFRNVYFHYYEGHQEAFYIFDILLIYAAAILVGCLLHILFMKTYKIINSSH